MSKFTRRAGERAITSAVDRCMNLLEEWKNDKQLNSRLRFEQSVRLLAKSIPRRWQDSQFVDDLFKTCLDLLERRGISFVKGK